MKYEYKTSIGFISDLCFSGNQKYRNVKFVTPTDAGYRAYKYQLIEKQRSNRTAEYVPQETTALYKVSLDVEHVVRKWFGSDFTRILAYEVFAGGKYHQHYKELDCVRFENDGSVTLCEIKASSNTSSKNAIAQLQVSSGILSLVYEKMKLVTINVDMAGATGTSDFTANPNHAFKNYKLSADGIGYYSIILAPEDIKTMSTDISSFRISLFEQACEEAIQCVINRRTKHMELLLRKFTQRKDMETQPSAFGLLLQSTLTKNNLGYLMAKSA